MVSLGTEEASGTIVFSSKCSLQDKESKVASCSTAVFQIVLGLVLKLVLRTTQTAPDEEHFLLFHLSLEHRNPSSIFTGVVLRAHLYLSVQTCISLRTEVISSAFTVPLRIYSKLFLDILYN